MALALKRYNLPPFIKLKMKFNIKEIQKAMEQIPSYEKNKGNLKNSSLEFESFESAYKFLQYNDVIESELRKGLPKNKRMAWDFKNYVKPFENYIYKTKSGHFKINGSPYKQITLTEFNLDEANRKYKKKIPISRLDERHYNKIKKWVKGTYFEEVLKSFHGEVHRARIVIMDSGAFVSEHIDYDTDYSVRYHIAITTNINCGFYVRLKNKKENFKIPADGSVWFLNQGLKHSAWNKGSSPRVHLILSVNGQDDLKR